jgi:thioredoxin 1
MKNLNCLMILACISSLSYSEMQISNSQQFNAQVLKSNQPVIAKFSADFCPSCKQAKPIFSKLSKDRDFDGVLFVSVDTDANPALSQKYNINGIPAFIIFNDGMVVDKQEGMRGDLKQQLLQGLKKISKKKSSRPAPASKEVVVVKEVAVVPANVVVVEENPAPIRNLVKDSANTTGNFLSNMGDTINSWFN